MPMPALDDELPELSKTRKKRAMEELQLLGEALAALSVERLKKIDLSENLREAIDTVRRMPRQDEAQRRQMQYIGRLMRHVDSEPIRAALAEARGDSATATAHLYRIERLRDALLENEAVLTEIAELHPGIDLQRLRFLRRATLKEKESGKPPRSYRAIFQMLKDTGPDE
jgi:ribosome-associated protein